MELAIGLAIGFVIGVVVTWIYKAKAAAAAQKELFALKAAAIANVTKL